MKPARIFQLIAIAAVSLLLAQCVSHQPLAAAPSSGPDSGLDATLPA